MELNEAISKLKNIVQETHIPNQMKIELTLISAEERPTYEEAMVIVQTAVQKGEISQDELKEQLGI